MAIVRVESKVKTSKEMYLQNFNNKKVHECFGCWLKIFVGAGGGKVRISGYELGLVYGALLRGPTGLQLQQLPRTCLTRDTNSGGSLKGICHEVCAQIFRIWILFRREVRIENLNFFTPPCQLRR